MADVGSANIRITADDSSARKTVGGFFGFLKKTGSIAAGVMGGLAVFDTIKSSMQGAYEGTIGANSSMEQYQNTLSTVLKSSQKATETLAWAQKFAAKTPFEIPDIVEATTRLSAYGINAKDVLTQTGNMAAVMGKPLMSAVEAVADAQTGELERLKEFGITKQMLIDKAAEMGNKEVVNAKGQITNQKALNDALFALMDDRFKGGMDLQSKTFAGLLSNAKDAMGTAARILSQPLFEKLKAGLASVVPAMSGITQFIQGDIVGFETTMTKAFGQEKGLMVIKFFLGIQDAVGKVKKFIVDLKPAFENFVGIVKNLAPTMGTVWDGVKTSLSTIMEKLPPLLEKITGILEALTGWEGFIPILSGIVAGMGTYAGAIAAVTKAQEIYQIVVKNVRRAQELWTIATVASTAAGGGLRGAMAGMRAAMASLNLTMLANPIVLIVALLVGLGVALVVAYKKSDTFRAIVDKTWKGIKAGFAATIDWFTTTLPKWVMGVVHWFDNLHERGSAAVQRFYKAVLKFFSDMYHGVVNWAVNLYNNVTKWFSNMVDKGVALYQSLKNKTINTIKDLVAGVINWFTNLYNGAVKIVTNVKNKVVSIWNSVKSTVVNTVKSLYNSVVSWFTNLYNGAVRIVTNTKNKAVSLWNTLKNTVVGYVKSLWTSVTNLFSTLLTKVSGLNTKIRDGLIKGWDTIKSKASSIFKSIWKTITDKIGDIVKAAGEIPGKIGSAITKKVKSATGAMSDLAKSLIKKFKSALGINSPSTVFFDMAGWIIKGLVNGLSAGNLKDLGSKAFKDFAGGAFNTLSSIKDWVKGGFSLGKGAGGNIGNWIKQAMAITKTPMSWLGGLTTIAKKESNGNPRAVNNWDINAKKGIPSMGLMQTIMPTFQAYAKKGFGNIMNPVHNAIAAINYIKDRYGSIFNTPGIKSMMRGGAYKGYEYGGFSFKKQMAWLSENNQPEAIVPLVGKRMDPFAVAVASKLGSLFNGNFGSGQDVHNHYWNVKADEINEVQKLIGVINGVTQMVKAK